MDRHALSCVAPYPVTDALRTCWRGQSKGRTFDHREAAAGVSRLPRSAHSLSLQERGRAMARRRRGGQFAGPWVPGHTDSVPRRMPCTHIAKVGLGKKPALCPAGAESRLAEMALKSSKVA
jgi:hypothetical protein